VKAPQTKPSRHPSVFQPTTLLIGILLALLGIVIGLQLLTRVGITPNSSIIGAAIAMAVARIPLQLFRGFKDLSRQNLLQTVISGATFGGANAILVPLGVMWLLGRPDLVPAMMLGAFLGLVVDATILYRIFDSQIYPASGAWPSGVATAEVLIAGDRGGRRAGLLGVGAVAGGAGQIFGIPMDVVGVCWIGNVWALTMFGVGLLVRGYGPGLTGIDLNALYVPHGVMIGAGVVALVQISVILLRRRHGVRDIEARRSHDLEESLQSGVGTADASGTGAPPRDLEYGSGAGPVTGGFGKSLGGGFIAFVVVAALMALVGGLATEMSAGMLVGFVLFAALAALASELIVGISAMHAGWFPAFATALIFLILGMLLGFPTVPLAFLVGFTASTGPAFADMGYDLKTGWILRGAGKDPEYERQGRRQQYLAELVGFAVAGVMVLLLYERYFSADLIPPVDRVYAATLAAGTTPGLTGMLLLWALPGALVQLLGGASRQIGILFATGLLIHNPVAGWAALMALAVRGLLVRRFGKEAHSPMYVLAGGFIAGSALAGFGTGVARMR
jgi:uncharacterized oligopeptide transporter (OPT) family protein